MPLLQVMLDLETLGTGPDAVILSIGAVKFDPGALTLDSNFYVTVDPKSCQSFGLTIDAATVLWWFKPEHDDARGQLLEGAHMDLPTALEGFALWMGEATPVWGNGALFDNLILSNAYKACGMTKPWTYKDDRCYRTVKGLFPEVEQPPAMGTAHNALDDARWQASHLQAIYNWARK